MDGDRLSVIEDDTYGFHVPDRPSLMTLIPERTVFISSYHAYLREAEAFNEKSAVAKRGVGIACMWYGCGNTSMSNPSTMRIGISREGKVTLYNGCADIGQGSNTIMIQIAADAVGLAADRFDYVMGDTDRTPDAGKSSASRQTFVSGRATQLAGEDLRRKILRLANAGDSAAFSLAGSTLMIREGEARPCENERFRETVPACATFVEGTEGHRWTTSRSLAELLNGKPAPKRARRFAFDFGSIGLALKAAFGGASGATLAAGVAAAVVMATTLGGSVERPAAQPKATVPVTTPTLLPQDELGAKARGATKKSSAGDKGPEKEKSTDAKQPAPPPEDTQVPGLGSSVGKTVNDVVGLLPLAPEDADTAPLATATDLVDDVVDDVGATVDDVADLLP